jgi:tetratricopeptide (TPR) repeat protein
MTDRPSLLLLIRAAQAAGRHDFARSIAADWLAAWPGDLEVQALLAQAEIALGHRDLATDRLGNIVVSDPEYAEAYDLLADCLRDRGEAALGRIFAACSRALRGGEPDRKAAPPWAGPLGQAIRAIAAGESSVAVAESQTALTANADLPLPALIAAKAHLAGGDRSGAYAIAKAASERWPECVPILLLQASELLEGGQGVQAVEFLQRAAALDPTSRITDRLLGTDHPFRGLWPTAITASLSRPVPADVAAVLGDNRLGGAGSAPASSDPVPAQPSSEPSGNIQQPHAVVPDSAASETPPSAPSFNVSGGVEPPPGASLDMDGLPAPLPWEAFRGPDAGDDGTPDIPDDVETLVDIRKDLDRMAAKLGSARGPKDEDGRVPAYIVLSSRTRLAQEFGEDRFRRVDEAVMTLVEAVRRRRGWTAYRVYIDDPNVLLPFGLTPADPGNAWQIKLRLADLDHALASRGEMIGAVLILGGSAIVPFHLLPNPTDDDDQAVPSDNPYSTTDENYFVPEWPVGRFPVDKDADFLVRLLRGAINEHLSALQPPDLITRLREWLATVQAGLIGLPQRSIGYSASIWRRSSLAVYRTIGEPRWMVTSPPAEAGALPAQVFKPARLSYFNLHGLEDSPEWFGQRDPARDPAGATEFPVALRPQDIVNGGRAPRVVFTEACYGANAVGKGAESSMSLKFLDSGSRAVVGSTKVSYGSVTPPLIGADLLGRLFWEHLNAGVAAGEALRRAKLGLAAEMVRRQTYLDGEDQKTLISFVLYGDPLFGTGRVAGHRGQKTVIRRTSRPKQLKTACALGGPERTKDDLDAATTERVRAIVTQYLPGMQDASACYHTQHCGCDGEGHACPTHQLGNKQVGGSGGQTMVITLSKTVPEDGRRHAHFARLTLDPGGKVLKLAISR